MSREQTQTFVTSTGATIFYHDYMPAEGLNVVPLLCLHGFMRTSRDFRELGETLSAAGVRVVAPDMRGRGRSSRFEDPSQYHYDLTKQDVLELLDHLEIEKVAILGTALGAFIAQDFVAELHGRVTGILLNDQGTEIGAASASKMANNVQAADYSFEEAVDRMKLQFGETYPGLNDERWVNLTLRAYAEVRPGRWARDFDLKTFADIERLYSERPDGWPQFLNTRGTPVTILRGELSSYFPEECAQRMLQQHSDAVLTTIKDRGHPPLLDEPDSLAAIFGLLGRASK